MKKVISRALLLQLFMTANAYAASCPMGFDYVHKLPWDVASCSSHSGSDQYGGQCYQTLLCLFGVGIAQHLKDSTMFMFPDYDTATACLNEFQKQLSSMVKADLPPNLVARCLNDTSMFVSSPNLCDGIQTKQDWIDLVGTTAIDSSCSGDLSNLAACDLCRDGATQVISSLVGMNKNASERTSLYCIYFTRLYAAGVVNEFGPKNPKTAFCTFCPLGGLPLSPTKTNDRRHRLVSISACAAAAVIVVSVLGLKIVCLLRAKRSRGAAHRQFIWRNRGLLSATVKPNTGAVWFSIQEINAATDSFSRANVIGQGGFGTVFKGMLPDGHPVAVKRIRNCSAEGDAEFLNEVKIINNIRHRNLVALRGCCVASDNMMGHQRFLIHDYMPNGDLDEHLFGGRSKDPLNWPRRKNIVLGTAKGLAYLHRGVQPAIYHRDIKPTNILLDEEMNARVSDFGLARIVSKDGESHLTTRVAGTHGYMAPEYALYGQLTEKSDVYSFGAVLLEIMSGRKALDTSLDSASDYLITDWAWTLVKSGKAIEIVDERIRHKGPERTMVKFVTVGILCAHVMVAFRPTIVEALKMLEGDIVIPEIPDRPLPLTHESLNYGNNENNETTLYFSTSATLCPMSTTE